MWQHTRDMLVLMKERQEDGMFKASPGHVAGSCFCFIMYLFVWVHGMCV